MKRDLSMDALRGVAALFVVLLHVTALRLDETSGPQWAAINLLNGLTRWTVPVFIMLSGAFLPGRWNEDTGGLWAKRVGRTAGILLFWNIVYFFARTKGTALPSPHDLIYPNAYHLWFMYLLTGLYALLPLLRRIAAGRTEGCFVALWTVLCIVPLTFGAYGGITLPTVFRPVGYAGYFVLGHFLYERRAWLKGRLLAALLATGTAAAACATWLTHSGSLSQGRLCIDAYDNLGLCVLLTSVAVFAAFTQLRVRPETRAGRTISLLAESSAGIYLTHLLFVGLPCDIPGLMPATAAGCMAAWTAVCAASLALIRMLAALPVLRRTVFLARPRRPRKEE